LREGKPRTFLVVRASQERFINHRVAQGHPAQEIVVFRRQGVGLARRRRLLNIGLDDRAMGSQVLEELLLVLYDSVQQSIDGISSCTSPSTCSLRASSV